MAHEEVQGLLQFLRESPTAFHAVESICSRLTGFEPLQENARWRLQPGGRYYVTRNRSSVIAFTVPQRGFAPFQLIASHTDSPTFRIKENAELTVRDKYVQLDVERYGGMILNTWLDRPLSVAGRLAVRTQDGVRSLLVNLDEDSAVIPNVAIHMNREINTGYKYNPASDMMPLWSGGDGKGSFRARIAQAAGVAEGDIIGSDLYLYNRMPGCVWGGEGEYLSAGRLDDLECAYTTARAMIECRATKGMPVLAVFDNEEVGSTTKQGADSTFLTDVLRRAALCLGVDGEAFYRAQASSVMLSCDNAHAAHPNHPELYDASNRVYMNEGIVIKESANQKYTSDGASKAILRAILDNAGVKYQFFANRSDMLGGGTLGNISNAHFSLNTVDIGLAQLAMHSSWETAGSRDVDAMADGVRAFFETPISMPADGVFALN